MNPRSLIGTVLVVLGLALWFFTPHGVTWGNHHYLKHGISYALIGVGVVFVAVGSRGR